MREIKFRAFDEGNKIMHYDFQFIKSGDEGNDWIIFTSDKNKLSDKPSPLQNPYFSQQCDTSKFENVQYVTERLKDNQKSLELFNNKFSPEQIKINAELNFKYNDYIDKINFFSKKLKELTEQGKVFNKESLKDKKFVKVRGDWEVIVKLNAKTVSVKTPYSWTDKIAYEKITDSK